MSNNTEFKPSKLYVGGTDAKVFWEKYYGKYKQEETKVMTLEETLKAQGIEVLTSTVCAAPANYKTGDDYLRELIHLLLEPVEIKFAKLRDDVKIPTKRDEDAGMDVYANFEYENLTIPPHHTVMIPTGLKSAFSKNYYIKLCERGSTGSLGISQRAGVIDAGYRDEWFVPVTNTSDKWLVITKDEITDETKEAYAKALNIDTNQVILYPYKKAICQAIIRLNLKTDSVEVTPEEIDNISSERGKGALGSSGK
jgi:dUTP pyrophosphatase